MINFMERANSFLKNGDCYDGQYSDGQKNGQGKLIYATGDKYKGTFSNDLMHGKFIHKNPNGEKTFVEFVNGKQLN